MGQKNPAIDAYIAKSATFAKPILKLIREVIHAGCPDVEESIKWSCPHFLYKGMFCHMAAFNKHCGFGFWGHDMREVLKALGKSEEAMGQFGCLTSVDDLPSKAELTRIVKQAKQLKDEAKPKPKAAPKKKRPPLKMPAEFVAALGKNKKAHKGFTALASSHQREYVEWIVEAKRDETRKNRIKTALEWLAEGKSRNWKYERR